MLTGVFKGWGFCHKSCQEKDIFGNERLKKVRLTILNEKICKIMASMEEDNFHSKQVFNKRNELCTGFLKNINLTVVNFTLVDGQHSENSQK